MPVKVRCPGCEKVLTVPDKAIGKAVRCPKCETRVKVPARRRKKRVRRPEASSDAFLGLNIHEAEDRSARICPRCGTNSAPEDVTCANCGVDLATGQVTDAEMVRRRRIGPDPQLYYKAAWVDSWDFMRKNKKLAFRTIEYWLLFAVLLAGCGFMVDYSTKTPPKVFWAALGLFSFLAFPGWLWTLTIRIVLATAGKRKIGRVNFDIFLSIAFGVKWVLWWSLFSFPAWVLAAPFLLFKNPYVFHVVNGVTQLVVLAMVPIAIAHMSMPITWKAWVSPMLTPILLRNLGRSLWWTLIFFTVMIICFAPLAGAGIGYAETITATIAGGGAPATVPLIVLGTCFVVSHLMFAFGAIYLMRATGLYAYYNKQTLDLVTMAGEKTYVPKPVLGEGETAPLDSQKAVMMVGLLALLGLAGGLVYSTLGGNEVGLLSGMGWGIFGTGILVAICGRFMVAKMAWKESTGWGWAVLVLPFADFFFLFKHSKKALIPMAIQYSSIFFYGLGILLIIFGAVDETVRRVGEVVEPG